MSNYSKRKVVNLSYGEAVERGEEELKKEGFGVLTEIDVKATLKEKIDKEYKDSGETAVAAIDPRKVLTILGNKDLNSVANQVGGHMERVIANF